MRRFWLNHKKLLFFLVIFVVLGTVFVVEPAWATHGGTHPTPGEQQAGKSSIIASVLTEAILGVIQLLGKLLTVAVSGIVAVSEYNDFINALAVVNGWVIVRDVANMFFIIVLLIIAFGTILGQEEYHYKKLLPKMLILAVLVNFSRTIVGVMIDFSQVVMLTFVNGYKAAAGGNFANIFQIIDLLKFNKEGCKTGGNPGGNITDWGIFGAALLALIMVVVSIITVAVILSVLVLRVITLWLLTVMSPLAFLAGTFPQGQKYYAQWWEEFKNMVMVGPLLAFFLWLSLVTVGSGNAISQITRDGKAVIPAEGQQNITCSAVGSTDAIMSFIIGNLMLLAGTQMAQQMGGAIAGIAGQARGAATRALKFGAKSLAAPFAGAGLLAARRFQTKMVNMSAEEGAGPWRRLIKYAVAPQQSVAGFMQRGKELNEEALQKGYAAAQDDSDQIFTLGKVKRYNLRTTEASQRQHLASKFAVLGRTEQSELLNSMMGVRGTEAQDYRRALVLSLTTKGYLDDYAETKAQDYRKVNREKYGATDGSFYDDRIAGDILADILTNSKPGEGKAKMLAHPDHYQSEFAVMADLEEVAKATGHGEIMAHSGEKATEGENRGKWQGIMERGYKTKVNDETGQKDFIGSDGSIITDPTDSEQFVRMIPLGDEFDKKIMTGKIKFEADKDAFVDQDTKAVVAKGGEVDFYNHDRVAYATTEGAKESGANRMARSPHTFISRIVNDDGRYDQGFHRTPMQKLSAKQMNQSGEQRRVQDRVTNATFGKGYQADSDNFTIIVKDEDALKRIKGIEADNPALVAMMFGQAVGREARTFSRNSLTVTVKGKPELEHTVRWSKIGKDESGGEEGGSKKKQNAGGGGGSTGAGPTINVRAELNMDQALQGVVDQIAGRFSSLGIDEKIERLSAQQADAVAKAMDQIVPRIRRSEKEIAGKFSKMYDKMNEVGHQSAEFSDYFKRNFKKEDWEKLKQAAEE